MAPTDDGPSPQIPASASFEAFYVAAYPGILRTAWIRTGNASEAEHIAQETFTRALERWDRLSRYDSPGGWVYRVCLRLSEREWRRARRHVPIDDVEDPHARAPLSDPDLIDAIRRLPKKQFAAVTLFYLIGYSAHEAASILRCKESTLRVTLHNARKSLRSELEIHDDSGDAS